MMVFVNIALGVVGLGIVVFVHELGHFLVAKASGITVEAFSLGWGRKIAWFRRGETEYRLSIFPVGGYCKMKGEELLGKALDEGADKIQHSEGSLFSVGPLRRIATYAAGPAANFLFAVLVLGLIWFIGFTEYTYGNRIVLISDYPETGVEAEALPADKAGLRTGDRIIAIDDKATPTFRDIQGAIVPRGDTEVTLSVERDGRILSIPIRPALNRTNGSGSIGVSAWVEPLIDTVRNGSPADIAGMQPGDMIITAAGMEIRHHLDLHAVVSDSPSVLPLTVERNGRSIETNLVPEYDESGEARLGMTFAMIEQFSRVRSPFIALTKGFSESIRILSLTLRSLGLLFKGINLSEAVSGPLRITYYVGQVANSSFRIGIGEGLRSVFRFLSFLSIALCFGNLLPIPALDGGQIILFSYEGISRRTVNPKVFYRYQIIGFGIILTILFLTTFSDLFFLIRQ
jgi:regulator of sigma E protease